MDYFERIERSNDARSYYPSDVAETILNQNKIVLLLPINISVAVTIFKTNWVMLRSRLAVCCNWFAEITQNQNRMRFWSVFQAVSVLCC